jgi:GNAT superfamily N-acetyltransferase
MVRPVRTRADLRTFIDFPYRHYRRDPLWVPPLRRDVATLLSRTRNPFFQHAAATYFLAARPDGTPVGRIAAIRNDAHQQAHPEDAGVGFFGLFESVDEQPVAAALLQAAADWLRGRGLARIRGPMNFSTNDDCGLLVDGFDTPPVLMMPHNPPYYRRLLETAGFTKAMDLLAYQGTGTSVPARLQQAVRTLGARYHFTLRALDMKHFWADVEQIKGLYNEAWETNWGFIPMTEAEMHHLARSLKPVVVPELVVFAYRGSRLVGFAIALPDFNQALRTNRSGRLFPLGLLRILWHQRGIRRTRVLTLGVLREFRKTGVDALMYEWIWRHGNARGYDWCESSWILETNTAMRNGLERMGFSVYKTYRVYDRAL